MRRRYTDEFKNQAVLLAKSLGRTAAARQLDISVRSLENWIDSQGLGALQGSCRLMRVPIEAMPPPLLTGSLYRHSVRG